MGYSTDFTGKFSLDKPLRPEHHAYLRRFSEKRHMKWRVEAIENVPDPVREAAGLPLGEDGGYFVGHLPADESRYTLDENDPPDSQPGLWCQWIPSEDDQTIQWDGTEKFYFYVEWLYYLIDHFIQPWGYILNGEVSWQGEEDDDYGIIIVKNNEIDEIWGDELDPDQ
jgi:hypothetical protein